jgi:hypothetical protein
MLTIDRVHSQESLFLNYKKIREREKKKLEQNRKKVFPWNCLERRLNAVKRRFACFSWEAPPTPLSPAPIQLFFAVL